MKERNLQKAVNKTLCLARTVQRAQKDSGKLDTIPFRKVRSCSAERVFGCKLNFLLYCKTVVFNFFLAKTPHPPVDKYETVVVGPSPSGFVGVSVLAHPLATHLDPHCHHTVEGSQKVAMARLAGNGLSLNKLSL